MSRETLEFLNNNTLIGMTDKRGNAWHRDLSLISGGLDNHYAGAIPEEDILSRLFNWEAIPANTYFETPDGIVLDENTKTWIRNDTYAKLGSHTAKYLGHGYAEWLVKNLSALVGGDADYANAGLLSGGAVAWVQIEMTDNVDAAEGVVIRPFILATTSFDGSIASTFKNGFTNVVCDNTFAMFMGEQSDTYRRKHTRNSEFNLRDASAAMNTLHLTAERAVKEIAHFTSIVVTDSEWSQFIEAHVPIGDDATNTSKTIAETKRQALTGLYRRDTRVAPWAGSAWGVLQAVNTYNQHLATMRNVKAREERQMMRAVKGLIGTADSASLDTLSQVMGRSLVLA